ncbi:MAG: type II secretion system F family protein [Candidatus Heimdallarchaeum endolithica]|uniref:Type II secretion system F family protein n=1 Tax=Candidatus Heimdallarchaeum endolithica TaxID=2876572 RepID=A0A9Y1BS36_9ARCH|nr:MAG: type II secretion system F family protein [Candidatus Heimdallarchaeum endolithica]
MAIKDEVEIKIKEFQISVDMIYWVIAIFAGLVLVVLGILDYISSTDLITILDINDFVILAIIISLGIPTFLVVYREERRQARIDANLPYLLREISNAQRTGMSLPRAIKEAAKRHYGPLTPELRKMSSKISWGIPFSKAMTDFQNAINTQMAQRATILILEAERSGGNLEDIFESTEKHVQQLLDLKKEREGAMKPYLMICYAAYIIFVLVVFILFQTFFYPFGTLDVSSEMFSFNIDLHTLSVLFLHMLAVQGFFTGLVAGKMAKTKVKAGLMHSVILMFVGWFAFKVLIQNQLITLNL